MTLILTLYRPAVNSRFTANPPTLAYGTQPIPTVRQNDSPVFTANPDTQQLGPAVTGFLTDRDLAPASHRVYALTLDRLVGQLGPDLPVAAISTPMLARFLATTYAHLARASHNRVVATLGSLFAYTTRQGWTPASPAAGLERRRRRTGRADHARTRPVPEAELLTFLTADHPMRDKTLWWLLYESAARAGEVLALNVEDLDLAHRRAVVIGKGGRAERSAGKPKPHACCPACCTNGGKVRCSWPVSPPPLPASPRSPTSTPTPVGPGCPTGESPKYSRKPPAAGHCTNCGTRG